MAHPGGRPKIEFENLEFDGWEILEESAKWGSEQYCADKLGVSVGTLARRIKERYGLSFAEYQNKTKDIVRANIRQKQYEVAMGGNPTMLIWTGKQECGQTDKNETSVMIENFEFVGDDDE